MAFEDPFWTLDEAVSWAMRRVSDAVEIRPHILALMAPEDFPEGTALWAISPALASDEAETEVLRLVQRGRIRAVAGGERLEPEEISAASITHKEGVGLCLALPANDRHPESVTFGPYFANLRLNSDDVRLHLPEPGAKRARVLQIAVGNPSQPQREVVVKGRKQQAVLAAIQHKWNGSMPAFPSRSAAAEAIFEAMKEITPDFAMLIVRRKTLLIGCLPQSEPFRGSRRILQRFAASCGDLPLFAQ